jgi:cell wall-associated NlpC family hydrolase
MPAGVGAAVLASGARYLGAQYQMGAGRGSGPVDRIDCSAFVSRAYSDATGGRVRLTAYTDAMYAQTAPVGADGPRPGDLVFYRGDDSSQPGTRYPHVALYVGPGRVLDASSVAGKVAYRTQTSGSGYTVEYRRVTA